MRILLAEDERITRSSLERRLTQWGHDVLAVEDGPAAWTAFEQGEFDAVLTDWQMPGLSGPELIRRIRAAGSNRYVYLIVLTARTDAADAIAGLDAGADDFLRKPCDIGELRARIAAGQRIIDLERALAAANRRMQLDLQAAAAYVRSLIPLPLQEPVYVDWKHQPAVELAGDSLGYHFIDERHLACYLLDVTGHGLDAALLSVTVLTILRSMSLPDVDFRQPAEVLSRLNERFPMESHGDRCFTIWYGVLDTRELRLSWAGAGHPAALLLSSDWNEPPTQLASQGPMIGMLPHWEGASEQIAVPPEAELLVFSDGVYELERPDGAVACYDDLLADLPALRQAPASLLDAIWERAREANEGALLDDDFTILSIRS